VLVAILAIIVGLTVDGLRDRLSGGEEAAKIEAIAVLPLDNLSGDPEQEYFADGMTEALTAELGKVGALRVISRTSVMMYKDVHKPLADIARELNVDAVVEGSVLRSGDRVRITTQLVQAVPERHLWAESYERDLRDILSLQSEVARAVAQEIQVTLTPQEEALLSGGRPVNPEAHEAYLLGLYYLNELSPERILKAPEQFRRSIDLAPSFALAYSGLAYYFSLAAYFGFTPPAEALPKAKALSLKAIELDETLSDAHVSLGFVFMSLDWDWLAAEKEFKRAIELNPNSVWAHGLYGIYLSNVGRLLEGTEEVDLALELDPLSNRSHRFAAMNSYYSRQYDECIERNKQALESKFDPIHQWYLCRAFWQKGMYKESWEALMTFNSYDPSREEQVTAWKQSYEEQGYSRAMLAVAQDSEEFSTKAPLAYFYIHAGKREKALEKLEQAFEERDPNLGYIKVAPEFDELRDDPRFQDIVRRMNFPE
jgi:TolB-like protein/Tfp pilus assembly protein PilF